MEKLIIAGVMTGTSADGVDVSLLSFHRKAPVAWKSLSSVCYPFSRKLTEEIIRFQEGEYLDKKGYLEFALSHGSFVGRKVAEFMRERFRGRLPRNAAIAYHGQTIAHFPEKARVGKSRYSSTLQAGESSIISRITGLTVVSDFRQADIAAGGSGAPLTPPFHALLLKGIRGTNAYLNLGGIGNLTVVKNGKVITASDTGPGNMLIDGAVRYFTGGKMAFDMNGKIARSGTVSDVLLGFIMARDIFLKKRKPASTGREIYGEKFLQEILFFAKGRDIAENDVVATLTYYTAFSVARFLKQSSVTNVSKVFVGGGGAKNCGILSALSDLLPARIVTTSHDIGVAPDFVESHAFAYLGYLCLAGIFVDTAPFTGGGRILPGKITPGENYRQIMEHLHRP